MPFLEEIKRTIIGTSPSPTSAQVFLSSRAGRPAGDGPFVFIIETGGTFALRTQNVSNRYERPTAQISVTATDYVDARQMARAIADSLRSVRNTVLGAYSVSITTLTRVGTTATATSVAHGFVTGQSVTIAGANEASYNGTYTITVTGDDTFTFTVAGSPATPATGTITASFTGTTYLEIDLLQEPFDMGTDTNARARVGFNIRVVKHPS